MEDHEEHWTSALTHGRYLLDPGTAGEGAPLLVGFHGYGENAERHLEQLRRLPGAADWVVCSVAALHPFYNTKTGDVIGSWMTSQGRELAIDDNVAYVAGVVSQVRRQCATSNRLVFAGFSQGVAMAYRAAARCGFKSHGLIALAGDVPPDVATAQSVLPPVLLGRGTADAWYTEEKMAADLAALERLGVAVATCVFEGGHEWNDEFRQRAGELLRDLR